MVGTGCRKLGSPCLEAETNEVFSFHWKVLSGFEGNVPEFDEHVRLFPLSVCVILAV